MKKVNSVFMAALCLAGLLGPAALRAQTIPGPADAGRIRLEERIAPPQAPEASRITAPSKPAIAAPPGASTISFTLNSIIIKGATVFPPDQLQDIYGPYIGKKITLDIVWLIAGAITERYRNAGYFLSEARVPMQAIHDGKVEIDVVEGYVGDVKLAEDATKSDIVDSYISKITAMRPARAQDIESILLRLNDLPGVSYRAVLGAADEKSKTVPSVTLTLVPEEKPFQAVLSADNYGSRFLGPQEASVLYSASLLPMQQTTLFALGSLSPRELQYYSLTHSIALAPGFTLEFNGGVTKAHPGYTLEVLDIKSESDYLSAKLAYQLIRQRQENLSFSLTLDGRDTTSDIAGAHLTRDRIRAARMGLSYDVADDWAGYNFFTLTLTQGLPGLHASHAGDIDLSRAEAHPDFSKMEIGYTRTQSMNDKWMAVGSLSAQAASGPLYSAEEFGYGGKNFGRAFDESEITGDHGVAASLEFRHNGWTFGRALSIAPYVFGDIGKIWNDDIGQPAQESAASVGGGVRFSTVMRFSGNLGIALPVFRSESTPIYGWSGHSPRILLQIQKDF